MPAKSVSWVDLAAASKDASKLPEGLDPEALKHELDFDGENSTFPFGAHVSVVEVDTETGHVEMLRHIAVDDCGRILNPMLVRGQQHGGIAQGAAQALYEEVLYDEDGNPCLLYTSPPPTRLLGDVVDTMMEHARRLVAHHGGGDQEPFAMRDFRKHTGWYLSGYPVGPAVRREMSMVSSLQELADLLGPLDRSLPIVEGGERIKRGHTNGPRKVSLPDGYLDHLDDQAVPDDADVMALSGG